jgi:hypothetical protein
MSQPLFNFFIFVYFFILLKAMNGIRAEQVRLIGAIYAEPLVSCAPTIEEIIIFEQ